jgi:hypothetical protein
MTPKICQYCPDEQAKREAAQQMASTLQCERCGLLFYVPGMGQKVPGFNHETRQLTPTKSKIVVLENDQAWQEYRVLRGLKGRKG